MEAVVASPCGDTVVALLSPKQGWAQRGAGGHWQPWRRPAWWQFGTQFRELGRGVTPWLCCVAPLRLPWVATDEPEQPLVPQPCELVQTEAGLATSHPVGWPHRWRGKLLHGTGKGPVSWPGHRDPQSQRRVVDRAAGAASHQLPPTVAPLRGDSAGPHSSVQLIFREADVQAGVVCRGEGQ